MMGLFGKKKGMTQIFDKEGNQVSVTVVEVGPCVVAQKKTKETDGYESLQIGFESIPEKKVGKKAKAYVGHFLKGNLKPFRYLREFRTAVDSFEVGQSLTVGSFQKGDHLDVSGVSKGKGFQGVIKRHHKHGGPASHGSRFHRTTGSIGQRTSPGEVFKNMRLPGHMGSLKVTTKNLEVIDVRPKENLLFIRGSVPGGKNGIIVISHRDPDFSGRFKKSEKVEQKVEPVEEAK